MDGVEGKRKIGVMEEREEEERKGVSKCSNLKNEKFY